MLRISSRTNTVPYSPIRKLMPFANAAKAKGIEVYHLNIGQPDIKTPTVVLDYLKNTFDKDIIRYSPSGGEESLVTAIRNYYARREMLVDSSDILITNGGSEAIIFAILAIAEPDEEFIVPEPVYTNYVGFAAMCGVKLIPVTTYAEKGFHLPKRERIEAKINLKTRGIILCNPNNPTGAVYSYDEIEMIVDIALKNKLFVISDEVYGDFIFDDKKYTHLFDFYKNIPEVKNNLIVIDSVSKKYSSCGARIGAVITKNKALMDLMIRFAQARLCVPMIEQLAMAEAFDKCDEYLVLSSEEYQRRRDTVWKLLSQRDDIIVKKPEGAFYCMIRLPIRDAEVFAKWLLTDFSKDGETVMIAPAKGFYISPGMGHNEIRLAYVLNCEKLKKGVTLLFEAIDKYKKIEQILISGSKTIS